jgi:hypothetical protein
VAVAALWLHGCTSGLRPGEEALHLEVVLSPDFGVTQLRLTVHWPDGDLLGPLWVPKEPGRVLGPKETVRLILRPDAHRSGRLLAEGLREGEVVATGWGGFALVDEGEAQVALTLAPVDDLDDGCGGCAVGQSCVDGVCRCTAESCATGCCEGDVCVSGDSPTACGTGGQVCAACPSEESCQDGRCSGCAQSCAGCCAGAVCIQPSLGQCEVAGRACLPCDPLRADQCSDRGECRCGTGEVCAAGQRCERGSCICDDASCPGGCCEAGECRARALDQCGAAGQTCVRCDASVADNCSASGECRCGGALPCGPGQRCLAGQCVCDAQSCVAGCCQGNTCRQPNLSACGAGGSACAACNATRADTCAASGECRCGPGTACPLGQRCSGGNCVCDPSTCNGCCAGPLCLAGAALSACGASGATCVACDEVRADNCAQGSCRCGAEGPCAPGQACLGGACVCGPSSCAGCCDGALCQPGTDKAACGVGGGSCQSCKGAKSCTQGSCG